MIIYLSVGESGEIVNYNVADQIANFSCFPFITFIYRYWKGKYHFGRLRSNFLFDAWHVLL